MQKGCLLAHFFTLMKQKRGESAKRRLYAL